MANDTELCREAAFAAYGRVMAKIGAFEQFLRIALGRHEIERFKSTGKELNTEAYTAKIMKLDFGSLAHQVCTKFQFDADLRNAVKQAKGFRNNLAHQFWVTQFHNLHTDRGLEIIRRECALYDQQFERLAALVVSATGVDSAHYAAFVRGNSDRPEVFKEWEERLERAESTMRETGELFRNFSG